MTECIVCEQPEGQGYCEFCPEPVLTDRDPGDETTTRWDRRVIEAQEEERLNEYTYVTVTYRAKDAEQARYIAETCMKSPFWVCHSIETADDDHRPYEAIRTPNLT